MSGVGDDLEDRTTHEEVLPLQFRHYVLHGQMQLLNGERAALIEAHECAAVPHEVVQRTHTNGADPAYVPRRHRALRKTVNDPTATVCCKHDDVEPFPQRAGSNVGVSHIGKFETVLFK